MEKKLKGFKGYEDYLTYANVCLSWMNEAELRSAYDYLHKSQGQIDPVYHMRKMNVEWRAQCAQAI
jgi:hypothetical protein